jgi:hypothetical protein
VAQARIELQGAKAFRWDEFASEVFPFVIFSKVEAQNYGY